MQEAMRYKIAIEGAGMFSPLKIAVSYRDFIYYILQNETTNNQKTRSHALTVGRKRGRKSTFEAV
jgi:hypothetical protein